MKIKFYRLMYRAASFLTDCTNGFRPFVNCKLMLGTLLVGLTAASCSLPAQDEETEPEIVTCYLVSPFPRDTTENTQGVKPEILPESNGFVAATEDGGANQASKN